MTKEPTLVIMAAGMGSRYGGLKQMDPMDSEGNVIIDYSLFDAHRAGFKRVIFITKKDDVDGFKDAIGKRAEEHFDVEYVLQDLHDLPKGFTVPEGRIKPWGTAHAIYACRDVIDGPFAAINADDYYGIHAFSQIYDYLKTHEDKDKLAYSMVGYYLKNTVSDKGSVARGVCELSGTKLSSIVERTKVEIRGDGIAYTEDDGNTWTTLPEESVVSMNFFGFTKSIIDEISKDFPVFLEKNIKENPLKCEYYLPLIIDSLLKSDKCEVEVLKCKDKWYGVTYKEDKPIVMKAFADMKEQGLYNEKLWGRA